MTDAQTKLQELIARYQATGEMPPRSELAALDQADLMKIYVEQLISDKGVEATDELRAKLYNDLDDYVSDSIIKALPDYIAERVQKHEAEGTATPDVYDQAIIEAGINVSDVTENAMKDFREKFLNGEEM